MPNWCENKLEVTGDEKELTRFRKLARGLPQRYKEITNEEKIEVEPLCFHALVPIPDRILQQSYTDVGHEFERKYWGVKWGSCQSELVVNSKKQLVYNYNTPWGAATAFFEKLAAKFPKLQFNNLYVEPGMEFAGRLHCEDGDCQDQSLDYATAFEEFYGQTLAEARAEMED